MGKSAQATSQVSTGFFFHNVGLKRPGAYKNSRRASENDDRHLGRRRRKNGCPRDNRKVRQGRRQCLQLMTINKEEALQKLIQYLGRWGEKVTVVKGIASFFKNKWLGKVFLWVLIIGKLMQNVVLVTFVCDTHDKFLLPDKSRRRGSTKAHADLIARNVATIVGVSRLALSLTS